MLVHKGTGLALILFLCPCCVLAQDSAPAGWTALDNQAEQLYAKGDLQEAVRVAKLAVAAASRPPQISRSLDRLGFFEYTAGNLKDAEPSLRRALELRKTTFGDESVEYAESANDLALFCRDSGKLPEARTLAQQAVDIRTRKLENSDLHVAESLNTLASIYALLGEYDSAISDFEEARTIHESQPEPYEPGEEYGTLCVNLAGTYQRIGKYAKAEEFFGKGLAILRVKPGVNHPAYSASLVADAYLQADLGHYASAEKLYAESGNLLRQQLGEQHPVYATYLNNRAALYAAMGNVTVAEADYRKSLELKRKIYPPDALTIGASLRNLAHLVASKDPAESEALFQQAADLYARNIRAESYDYGSALLGLAEVQRERGELTAAEQSLHHASEVVAKGLGTAHPLYAAVLRDEALVFRAEHQYPEAEQRLHQAINIIEESEGENHPDLASYIQKLAAIYDETGDYRSAEPLYRRSLDISDRALTDILSVGSENARNTSLTNLDDPISPLIAFQSKAARQLPDAPSLAFEAVIRRKGRLLDQIQDWSQRVSQNANSSIRELFNQRQAMLECEASLTTALGYRDIKAPVVGTCSLNGTDLEGRYERLLHDLRAKQTSALAQRGLQAMQVLRQHVDTLEAGLSRDLPQFASAIRPLRMQDVAAQLKSGELLVEIIAYAKQGSGTADRYGAFVIAHDGDLIWLDLGPKATIDRAVRDLFAAANDWSLASARQETHSQRIAQETATDSMQILSQNLRPVISAAERKGVHRLRIAPDGMLYLVPFAALTDSRGTPVVQHFAISYISSSRDLIEAADRNGPAASQDSFIIAVSPGNRAAFAPNPNASTFRSDQLERLTNASIEARTVKQWIPKSQLLGEGEATEERIKELHHPALLHIVGHGLVKGDEDCHDDLKSTACQLGNSPAERVMSLAAIVLEEAYGRGGNSTQDGLLTALELQTLDLQGTEMLVLSQCRMADGVPSSADGVFGMRRAAAIAGVRTFVAPVWKIADGPQQKLIKRFYKELSLGTARDEALRRAQLELLHASSTGSFLVWAPMILSGDPLPVSSSWFER